VAATDSNEKILGCGMWGKLTPPARKEVSTQGGLEFGGGKKRWTGFPGKGRKGEYGLASITGKRQVGSKIKKEHGGGSLLQGDLPGWGRTKAPHQKGNRIKT